jgi:hypothetical protein
LVVQDVGRAVGAAVEEELRHEGEVLGVVEVAVEGAW